MSPKTLNVDLTLVATNADGTPFSETTCRSFNLSRGEFHELETELANMLLGLGDKVVRMEAQAAEPSPGAISHQS